MSLKIITVAVCAGICFTGSVMAGEVTTDSSAHKKTRADSLQRQADSLELRARELEKQLDTTVQGSGTQNVGVRGELDKIHYELVNLKNDISSAVNQIFAPTAKPAPSEPAVAPPPAPVEQLGQEVKVIIEEREEKRGSGSFIIGLEYTSLDVNPLENLAKNDRSLIGKEFDFSENGMMTFGLMGYYSKDHSLRVGNGLYIGYKLFQSEVFSKEKVDAFTDSAYTLDSIILLRVIPTHFGFLCEKAFTYDPVNFFAGFMIGGNLTVVVKEEQKAQLVSSFISKNSDNDEGRFSVALAPAVSWDVHGGLAVRLSDYMHLGVDGIVRFAYAYEGFGAGFGDYLSVSPGVRLRITFGNAG